MGPGKKLNCNVASASRGWPGGGLWREGRLSRGPWWGRHCWAFPLPSPEQRLDDSRSLADLGLLASWLPGEEAS